MVCFVDSCCLSNDIHIVDDVIKLEKMLLDHVRGKYLGCDEHSYLLDISHIFVGLK